MDLQALKAFRDTGRRFIQFYDPEKTAQYIHDCCPEEVTHLMEQVRELERHTFRFQDRWDMEPCPKPYTLREGEWLHSPNGDPEWVFMLNRHDYLPRLWQAAQLTGERRWSELLRDYLLDWTARNPILPEGTDSTRTIDTGIRCMNWCGLLLPLLAEEVLDDAQACVLLESMSEQFENLRQRYIPKYTLSNWGVLQTTAICAGYAWFREVLPVGLEEWAWNELEQQLELQILEDGAHWEQSAMYHVEVLNACTKLLAHLRFARAAGRSLYPQAERGISERRHWNDAQEAAAAPGEGYDRGSEGWLIAAIRVLSRHVLYTADPARLQLPQCDSDVTDVRDVMVRAAALLDGGGIYRFIAGERMDMDSTWLLGAPGIKVFLQQRPCPPDLLQWNCFHAGNYFWRSSWEKDADFTWLKNSALGSGHGHVDQTQLILYHKGKPFLVDSGRYTYREDDPLRLELKGAQAHNVCVIDGQSGGEPNGSWTFASYGEALKNYVCTKGPASYAELPVRGTLKKGTPYFILRKVLALEGGVWLTVQDVSCAGEHSLEEFFHMDEAVQLKTNGMVATLCNGTAHLMLYSDILLKERRTVHSKRYNEKTEASVLVKQGRMRNRKIWSSLLVDEGIHVTLAAVYQVGSERQLSLEEVTACDLHMPDGSLYTLILLHQETWSGGKMYLCHGIPFYGKTVVLHQKDGLLRRIRLKV